MPAPPQPAPPPPQRRDFFGQFRGMPWWQIVLVVLPLTLIVFGGLLGGVLGALAAIGNTYVARSSLSVTLKVLVMIGLAVAAYIVWFIVALVIALALHSATAS